jgi:hypothetical protein
MKLMSCKSKLHVEQLEDRVALDATSFVTGLYHDLLNRPPETAGLNFWVAKITGGESNHDVAQEIWQSAEHRGIEVDNFYLGLLHRPAEPAGRAFWTNQLLNGKVNEQRLEFDFVTSGEYLSTHSTAAAYVEGLYVDLLGRAPSFSEEAAWIVQLNSFGAGVVANAIGGSAEANVLVVTNDYLTYLGRTPDKAGLAYWVNQLLAGKGTESVAENILGSAEYAAKH